MKTTGLELHDTELWAGLEGGKAEAYKVTRDSNLPKIRHETGANVKL